MTAKRTGRRSLEVRLIWVAAALVSISVSAAAPILAWKSLQTVCRRKSACLPYQLNSVAAHTLASHGFGLTAYAIYTQIVLICCGMIWYGVGALIIWRNPTDRGALLAAFFLVIGPVLGVNAWLPQGAVSYALGTVSVYSIILFCLLFPGGRFAPRWMAWMAAFYLVFFVLTSLPIPAPPPFVVLPVILSLLLLVVGAQIYRYRVVSTWTERQQTKTVMFGIAVALVGLGVLWTIPGVLPIDPSNGALYGAFSNQTAPDLLVTALPLSIGLAILRSGLWEIDRVISRALVYGLLSISLSGMYIGSVLVLQSLFGIIAGNSSSLAIAASTLAIAALFGPMRHLIQTTIDRRFYRSRYDAQRTLASFGERLRDQVDLVQLSFELESVAYEALRPSYIALWLRPDGGGMGPGPGDVDGERAGALPATAN